jgi:hypothetical protein
MNSTVNVISAIVGVMFCHVCYIAVKQARQNLEHEQYKTKLMEKVFIDATCDLEDLDSWTAVPKARQLE